MTIRIEHFHRNPNRYVPVWAKDAVEDLMSYLDNETALISDYSISEMKLWNRGPSEFLQADFSRITTLSSTEFKGLSDIGWELEWFQTFGDGSYSLVFKFERDD